MYDNLVLPLLAPGGALSLLCVGRRLDCAVKRSEVSRIDGATLDWWWFDLVVQSLLPCMDKTGYADTESTGLVPAAVGERGVIRRRGRQMPALVCGIQACSVPAQTLDCGPEHATKSIPCNDDDRRLLGHGADSVVRVRDEDSMRSVCAA